MDEKYNLIESREDKVIEECSELIKEICKARRFGYDNYHPHDHTHKPNKQRILEEIQDVKYAIDKYIEQLTEEPCK